MQFNYPAGRTEPWLARFVQFRKSRDGATATGPGDRGDSRASVDEGLKIPRSRSRSAGNLLNCHPTLFIG